MGGEFILTYNAYKNIEFLNAKWPSDLPENIPPFTARKLIGVTKGNNGSTYWYITIDDVNKSQMAEYKAQLNESGWTTYSEDTFPGNITRLSKGGYKIILTHMQSPTEIDVDMVVSRK